MAQATAEKDKRGWNAQHESEKRTALGLFSIERPKLLVEMRMSTMVLARIRGVAVSVVAATVFVACAAGPSRANLFFNFFEWGNDVIIQASGSLDSLPPGNDSLGCVFNGGWLGRFLIFCTGKWDAAVKEYDLTFYSGISGSDYNHFFIQRASAVDGIPLYHDALGHIWGGGQLGVDSRYIAGEPIVSSAVLSNAKLDYLFDHFPPHQSDNYTLSIWRLNGTNEFVYLQVVPGPLPLLGVGSAFMWVRRLRCRVRSSRAMSLRG